jgi:hypothetical protein
VEEQPAVKGKGGGAGASAKAGGSAPHEVNYAASSAGAMVLDSRGLVGASNLLEDNKDKYARSPCDQQKWVVINLSEDVSPAGASPLVTISFMKSPAPCLLSWS